MKYKLAKLKKMTGEPVTVSSNPEGELIELDPDKGTKYVLGINVGDLPPRECYEFMQKIREQIGTFFGEGNVLFIPYRKGEAQVEIFELHPTD